MVQQPGPRGPALSTLVNVSAVHGLVRGDVGTAVLVHDDGAAFEVEFVGFDGHTVALLTLERDQVRLLHTGDIPHARELAHA